MYVNLSWKVHWLGLVLITICHAAAVCVYACFIELNKKTLRICSMSSNLRLWLTVAIQRTPKVTCPVRALLSIPVEYKWLSICSGNFSNLAWVWCIFSIWVYTRDSLPTTHLCTCAVSSNFRPWLDLVIERIPKWPQSQTLRLWQKSVIERILDWLAFESQTFGSNWAWL